MGHKVRLFLILLCLPFSLYADEQKSYRAIEIPSFLISHDSENFDVKKITFGALPIYQDALNYQGVQVSDFSYSNNDWSKSSSQINYINKSINKKDWLGHTVNLGIKNLGQHNLATADINYGIKLGETTATEVFFNRDYVETVNSLNAGIYYNYYGASIQQEFLNRFTLIGLLAQHQFSDDNTRNHIRARLIYDILPEYGINLQLRHRRFTNSDDPKGNYFNPDQYFEDMVAVGYRKRIEGWMFSSLIGLGKQKVNGDEMTDTKLLEAEIMSPLVNRFYLNSKVGYSESAGFNGPDYRYQYIQANLIYNF